MNIVAELNRVAQILVSAEEAIDEKTLKSSLPPKWTLIEINHNVPSKDIMESVITLSCPMDEKQSGDFKNIISNLEQKFNMEYDGGYQEDNEYVFHFFQYKDGKWAVFFNDDQISDEFTTLNDAIKEKEKYYQENDVPWENLRIERTI